MLSEYATTNAIDDGKRFDLSGMAMYMSLIKARNRGDVGAILLNSSWVEKLKSVTSASNETYWIAGLPVYFDPDVPLNDCYAGTLEEIGNMVKQLNDIRYFGGDAEAYMAQLRAKVPVVRKDGTIDG